MIFDFWLFLLAGALALRVVWAIVLALQHGRNARRLGCGPIPRYPSDWLGISNVRAMIRADKEKLVPELAIGRIQYMSDREGRYVSTFGNRLFTQSIIITVDPKNIQAMLATQFKDFELGKARSDSMHPLVGTGIVGLFSRCVGVDGR